MSTLLTWLGDSGDTHQAPKSIGVHVNTLRYRLRRIDDVIGLDLRRAAQARVVLHLQLLTRTAHDQTSAVGPVGPDR